LARRSTDDDVSTQARARTIVPDVALEDIPLLPILPQGVARRGIVVHADLDIETGSFETDVEAAAPAEQ
jgi:hypothetical protein